MKDLFRSSFLVFLVAGIAYSAFALSKGVDRIAIILPLIVATIVFNLFVEGLIPFHDTGLKRPYGRDILFSIFNIFITAKFGEILMVLLYSWILKTYFSKALIFESAALGPLWFQATVCVLMNEFVRYWSHFAQHKIPVLWKFHSIHHSVKEIYSLNTFYSHPFDYFFRNSTAWPFILLIGFSTDAVLIATAFVTVGGIFSHSRANFKFNWLNYVFSTNELHRWHHSTVPGEADKNFGVATCIFDLIFGTHYLPKDRPAPAITGLHADHPRVPQTFVEVMSYPVVGQRSKPSEFAQTS